MNIIKLLGIGNKEDIISNMLVGMINESMEFRNAFLENIVGINVVYEKYEIKAFTRVLTSVGIPDIVIEVKKDINSTIVVIENKLGAEEGDNQTCRYSSEICKKEIRNYLGCMGNVQFKFIYLTLIPEKPASSSFINKIYKNILENVDIEICDKYLNKLYKDFKEVLKEFYNGLDISGDDILFNVLYEEVDSQKLFVRFKNIIETINDIKELKIREIGKTGGKGRISFYAKISKESWIGKQTIEIDNKYIVNRDTFDIHLECAFDILKKVFVLPVHYETNPYLTVKQLQNNCNQCDIEKYLEKREEVKKKLHEEIERKSDTNIRPFNGSNQIASIKLNIDEKTTVNEFINLVKKYINEVSIMIDNSLRG